MTDAALCDAVVGRVRDALLEAADAQRAARAAIYFPTRPIIRGAPSGFADGLGSEAARTVRQRGNRDDALAIAEALYASGVVEEGAAATALLESLWRQYGPQDWERFETWLRWFNCWATTDSFALRVLGRLVLRDGPPVARLTSWARQPNRWVRRAALVSLIRSLRAGRQLTEGLALVDMLLPDGDDAVQKALGWTLKETLKGDRKAAVAYLSLRRSQISPIARRLAAERLTEDERRRLDTPV